VRVERRVLAFTVSKPYSEYTVILLCDLCGSLGSAFFELVARMRR